MEVQEDQRTFSEISSLHLDKISLEDQDLDQLSLEDPIKDLTKPAELIVEDPIEIVARTGEAHPYKSTEIESNFVQYKTESISYMTSDNERISPNVFGVHKLTFDDDGFLKPCSFPKKYKDWDLSKSSSEYIWQPQHTMSYVRAYIIASTKASDLRTAMVAATKRGLLYYADLYSWSLNDETFDGIVALRSLLGNTTHDLSTIFAILLQNEKTLDFLTKTNPSESVVKIPLWDNAPLPDGSGSALLETNWSDTEIAGPSLFGYLDRYSALACESGLFLHRPGIRIADSRIPISGKWNQGLELCWLLQY